MSKPELKLYFDILSPFAYIAFHIITNSKSMQEQCTMVFVPALLGGILKHCGNTPPLRIKNKDKWIDTERNRWAKSFSVPMTEKIPPDFPVQTLTIQRHMAVLFKVAPEKIPAAAAALYSHFFVDHGGLVNSEDFMPVLEASIGQTLAQELASKAPTEGKEILMATTEAALADGAFGMPWFVATDREGNRECFWGVDHLGQVLEHLGLEKPNTEQNGWRAML